MAENLIIIGSGPAGLTAAIYAARANLSPLLFTGREIGGQIVLTNEVENFPGFPEGIAGPELVGLLQKQADRFGARIGFDVVTEVNLKTHPFQVTTQDGKTYETKALIVATGASPRLLNVPGEKEYMGRGVSYCATCDGFFFRNKEIAVVGGGDSALQEGLFLTRFASKVHVIHRRDQLRAQAILQARARENPKMNFVWNSVVKEIQGNRGVAKLVLENTQTHALSELPAQGIFIYIGHTPNTGLFNEQLEMNEEGYIKVDAHLHTSVSGVFAAGEAHDHIFRQVVVSAGYGCMAAMEAEKLLAHWEHAHKEGSRFQS
jgi:thioredoxin reductase (NADPH)